MAKKEILTSTGQDIPGKKVTKVLGIVKGNTVRAKNIFLKIIKNIKPKDRVAQVIQQYNNTAAKKQDKDKYNKEFEK